MITPLVCLLSRPADAPTAAARIDHSDPELTPEEQRLIQAWSDHPGTPPLDQQGRPLAVFRCFPLPSGRLALSRLVALPGEAHGASAEVMIHTLVFEAGAVPGYPLDYHDWPGWQSRPGQRPALSPALEPLAPRLESLRAFLAADPAREPAAILLLAGMLSHDRHGRALLVRDLPERGLIWMACLQRLLPLPHALNLGLSSHEWAVRQPLPRLAATSAEGELDYRRMQQGEDYFIVDLPGRQRSTLPRNDALVDTARGCATRLVGWLLEAPARLTEFHDFVAALFQHEALTPELWWMLRLHEASQDAGPALTGAEVEPVLDILRYYTRPEAWEAVLGLLDGLAEQFGQNHRIEDDDALLDLLLEAMRQQPGDQIQRRVFRQWLLLFDRYLLAGEHRGLVLERYREVASLPLCEELHQQLLEAPRLARVQTQLTGLASPELGAVGWLLLDSALQLQHELDLHAVWLDPLLARLLTRPDGDAQLDWLLARADEPAPMAALLHRAREAATALEANRPEAEALLARLLHERLRDRTDAMALREALLANHDEALLVAEWRHQLAIGSEPRRLLPRYRREVLDALPAYRDHCFGVVCEVYFEALSETAREQQARDWLLGAEDDWWRLPDELAARCVVLGNRQLGLRDHGPGTRRLTGEVFARSRELGQPLQPDIPQLRRSLAYAASGELRCDDDWFRETRRSLSGLGEKDYRQFLDGVLDTLLRQALTPQDHGRILADLDLHRDILRQAYLAALSRLLARQDPLAGAVALRHWIDADRADSLTDAARERLLRGLARWPDEPFTALRQVLEHEVPAAHHTAPRWRDFWRDLDRRRQRRLGMLGRRLRAGLVTTTGRGF